MRRFTKRSRWFSQFTAGNSYLHRPDYVLQLALFFILLVGFFVLASAGSAVGYQKYGDPYYFLKHQMLVGLLPGLVLFWFLSKIDYHLWLRFSGWFGLLTLVLLGSVLTPWGTDLNKGARSWLQIFNLTMQPSELAKITFMLFFSAWAARKGEAIKNLWLGIIPVLCIWGVIFGLVAAQPDYGTMFIFVLIGFSIYFVAQGRWRHIITLIILGAALLGFLLMTSPHAKQRLQTFINPGNVNTQEQGYQLKQAIVGIGSGGIFGRGLGHSRQKFQYLPEATGDSIFAVIGEEMGFWFSSLLVVVYLSLFSRAIKIAKNASDKYGQLLATGLLAWTIGQSFLNIGAILGLVPLTGVPLPFISYGGTALAAGLAGMGILVNISKQTLNV